MEKEAREQLQSDEVPIPPSGTSPPSDQKKDKEKEEEEEEEDYSKDPGHCGACSTPHSRVPKNLFCQICQSK